MKATTTAKAKATATAMAMAMATTIAKFGFAQGRLFGDDKLETQEQRSFGPLWVGGYWTMRVRLMVRVRPALVAEATIV